MSVKESEQHANINFGDDCVHITHASTFITKLSVIYTQLQRQLLRRHTHSLATGDFGDDCYLTIQFWVTCNRRDFDPPKLFWGESEIEITVIYLDGQMRVMQYIANDCYYRNGSSSFNNNP